MLIGHTFSVIKLTAYLSDTSALMGSFVFSLLSVSSTVFANLHRFYWLCDTLVEGKSRKIISPKEGATPSPLPEWLSTPYLIRVPSQDVSYKPESLSRHSSDGGVFGVSVSLGS